MTTQSRSLAAFRLPGREPGAATIADFVSHVRTHLVPNGIDFESNTWSKFRISFGNIDCSTRNLISELTMKEPFLGFAKAFVIYRHALLPTKGKHEIRALRCLERVLCERLAVPDPSKMLLHDFDYAVPLAMTFYPGSSYLAGRGLAEISRFLHNSGFVNLVGGWRNPIKRPVDTTRTGLEEANIRAAKLPDQEVIDAIASIFASQPSDPRDILTTSTVAMLFSAPSRISELTDRLRVDSEIEERTADGTKSYGWRFFPSKGAKPYVKWIPATLEPVAREAFQRLLRMGEEARRMALFYETNEQGVYPVAGFERVSTDARLSADQLCRLTGLNDVSSSLKRHAKENAIPATKITIKTVRQWVDEELPPDFYDVVNDEDACWSKRLFCFPRFLFHASHPTSPILVRGVSANDINSDLTHREGHRNIFVRHGILPDQYGNGLRMTTHQARHLLNTIAQRGHLGQLKIAIWSGRANIRQNDTCDHVSHQELCEDLRDTVGLNEGRAAVVTEQSERKLHGCMSLHEFTPIPDAAVHLTEYGFCVHDFAATPCPLFRACLTCKEQRCVKGDPRLERVRALAEKTNAQLLETERAISEGYFGADRWFETRP